MKQMKQKKIDSKTNFLDVIPEINCRWEKNGDGRICLLVPRFKKNFMKRIALKLGRSEFVQVSLDNLGTTAWAYIDGTNTVEQIGKLMEKDKGESIEQVYQRLSQFLTILARNRLVSLKTP